MPPVSVILPVYNQEPYLNETIKSILSQSFTNFELLILDDGSTDGSASIIRSYAKADTRIIAYYEANAGKSEATNKLVSRASGRWCIFLDADDVMLPERIEKQLAFHATNPQVVASSAYCQYINERGNVFGSQRYKGLSNISAFKQAIARQELITCAYTALMVSRYVYIEAGGLLQRFEPCEDFEFFNRMAAKGYILLIIPEVLMKYRIHPGAVTVVKPMLILNTINYVRHCIYLRRLGEVEISFNDFMNFQNKQSWYKKFNRKRINHSMMYFRSAGFAMLSKNYPAFLKNIISSFLLSPGYGLKKFISHVKR